MKPGIVVLLSGGVDSTSLLASIVRAALHSPAAGGYVIALAVDYGQRHRRELAAARDVAAAIGVELVVADISAARPLLAGSSQTSEGVAVPHGHYTDETMAATVVPNRNLILLSLAGALAQSRGLGFVAYAAHAGDHPIYPDCRPEFARAAGEALLLGAGVRLTTPFIGLAKSDVVAAGHVAGAPLHLTWSCYEGGELHCGSCGTCVERREAFVLAGVPDPTRWAA